MRRQRHPDTRPIASHSSDEASPGRVLKPLPNWRWTTFPVFCALSIGLFVGVYAGVLASATDNSNVTLVVFIIAALFMGFSLSRVMTRFLVSHNWVKPRVKR